jgi:hypothetical protein
MGVDVVVHIDTPSSSSVDVSSAAAIDSDAASRPSGLRDSADGQADRHTYTHRRSMRLVQAGRQAGR